MAEDAMDTRCRKFAIRLSHSSRTCGLRFRGRENSNGWLSNLTAKTYQSATFEDAFPDGTGRSLPSRAAVSEIAERLLADYETCDLTPL